VQPDRLQQVQADRLQLVINRALSRSAETLSMMSGLDISISSSAVERVPLAEVPMALGAPDEPAVGVYVGMECEGNGYLLLLMDEAMAVRLAGLLLGEPADTIDIADELPASALAEAGNVSCSAFMNELGEATGLCLKAMPPVVVNDMRGAILDVAIADIAQNGDEALLIRTTLGRADGSTGAEGVNARLLVIPTPETLDAILERLGSRTLAEIGASQ
jgi:chemotaxis protein CheC